MNTQPRIEETLRKELLALGARTHELEALAMVPDRGLAALHDALARNAKYPVAYAIALFDSPEWNPSGQSVRRGTNVHAGGPSPMPPPMRERNLAEARKILAMLKGEK